MGKALMGGSTTSQFPTMSPEQQQLLSQGIEGLGPEMNQLLQQLLQPYDQGQMQDLFQQSFVDPAMQAYEQQALPAIQQRFVDANAGSSSALNQALGQSAADLSTMLGSQMGQFSQNQQQLGLQGQLGALGALQSSMGQQPFTNITQQQQGLLGPMIQAGGQAASGYFGGQRR